MLLSEVAAKYLRDAGVEVVYGLLGEGNMAIVTSMTEQGSRYVYVRREDAAVNMADGYARRTGKIGFASVTHGGGLMNSTTALTEATRRGSPLVLLSATTPRAMLHNAQRIPAEELVAVTGSGWREVRGPEHLADDIAAAFRDAWTNKRACVLAVPAELLYVEVDGLLMDGVLPESLPEPWAWEPDRLAPDPARVIAAVELIRAAERPVVVAGQGAWRSGAREALERLAEQIGGLLSTTLVAKGMFHGSELHIGICGGFATPGGSAEIQRSDLVLAFGCSLNPYTTMDGELFEGSKVIHCDLDPSLIGTWFEPDLGIVGDAATTAERLLEACKDAGVGGTSRVADLGEGHLGGPIPVEGRRSEAPFRTIDLVDGFRRMIPEGSLVATDAGHCVMDFITNLEVTDPEHFLFTIHAGSIGQALATSLGATDGGTGEWTFLFIGDSSLLYQTAELDTMRRLGLPIVVVVLDDAAWGAEIHYAQARGLPDDLAFLESPDFAAVAEGFGVRSHRIETLDDLDVVEKIVQGDPAPALLHIPIDGTVMNRWYGQFSSGAPTVRWSGAS